MFTYKVLEASSQQVSFEVVILNQPIVLDVEIWDLCLINNLFSG